MDLLEKMATYVRVVEAGSLSAAAKQLRISSAAVSRQIAALEAGLHGRLLVRTTRRMAVTEAGRSYYERCLRILREVEEAQAVGRGDARSGLVTVNAPVSFGLACVVPHVHTLMKEHPGLRIDLQLEDRLVDLLFEGVDVVIRVGTPPPESTEIVARSLASFRRVLVASPDYLQRKGEPQTPEALAKHEVLMHVAGSGGETWALTSPDREARVRLNVAFRSNALHAVRDLARCGVGIALLPAWFVPEELERGALRVVLPSWQSAPVAVNALHRREHRGEPRVLALVDHLRAAYDRACRATPREVSRRTLGTRKPSPRRARR